MSVEGVATLVVSALLGGGAATTIGVLARARIDSRKAEPEIDSIIVGGAEKAVTTMGLALQAAERRIDGLERERDHLLQMVESLRQQIEGMAAEIAALRAGTI